MKHVLQYKQSCVISKISNLADSSLKLWKHYMHKNAFAKVGPRGDPIATPSICL